MTGSTLSYKGKEKRKMRIPEKYKELYTCQLPLRLQQSILNAVERALEGSFLTESEICEVVESADCEKIKNLTDTIYIEFV